ncbi:hypothetical protein QGP82_20925 [Leptothoe sp. LEGE 181152]|nr:hypothetical protein [Leptothoe sp. LEGE 181152]
MEHELISTTFLLIAIVLGPLFLLGIMVWFTVNTAMHIAHWLWRAYQLKTTPCGHCLYYTGCKELACAVNPHDALTKRARDCKDFALGEMATYVSRKQSKITH